MNLALRLDPRARHRSAARLTSGYSTPVGAGPASTCIIIRLASPITAPRAIAEVVVREPTLAEVGALAAGGINEMQLICAMAGLSGADLAALTFSDAERIIRAAQWLLPSGGADVGGAS